MLGHLGYPSHQKNSWDFIPLMLTLFILEWIHSLSLSVEIKQKQTKKTLFSKVTYLLTLLKSKHLYNIQVGLIHHIFNQILFSISCSFLCCQETQRQNNNIQYPDSLCNFHLSVGQFLFRICLRNFLYPFSFFSQIYIYFLNML